MQKISKPPRNRALHFGLMGGAALTVRHTTEGCSALAELRQRYWVKTNLKEDLGNEQLQLAIARTLSFPKATGLLYRLCTNFHIHC